MAAHGYIVTYGIKWPGKKSSYIYQRFFRAIYGYTQVVSKANGKRYVYHRDGVLTKYPYIRRGKNTVVIPDNALQPLLTFFKTGKNPAHNFESVGNWSELVKYTISETYVDPEDAAAAILAALERIHVHLIGGSVPAIQLLENVSALSPDELYSLYYAIENVVSSSWYSEVKHILGTVSDNVSKLLGLVGYA